MHVKINLSLKNYLNIIKTTPKMSRSKIKVERSLHVKSTVKIQLNENGTVIEVTDIFRLVENLSYIFVVPLNF